MTAYGILRGVGVGPGDPQLLTFKAAEILNRRAVIAYVVDAHGESYARRTAAVHFPLKTRELPLHFVMSPRRAERLAARMKAARQVMEVLSSGEDVTFITEGDPLLYSTFQHLLTALPPEVPVEICPGVSSLTASAAEVCFPLPVEDERMVVATFNPETILRLPEWLEIFEVIVLFKAHHHIEVLQEVMTTTRHPGRVVLIQRATLTGQTRVLNLAAWDGSPLPYFTTVLIRSERGV
jgi:precorrin-2/cobalt-factor-2 C20-methyltransferase